MANTSNSGSNIGFDLEEANILVKDMGSKWAAITLYEKEKYIELRDYMRTEWVGPDEQQFEQAFTMRLRKLYDLTEETVSNACAAVTKYANTWANWQLNNNKVQIEGLNGEDSSIVDSFIQATAKATDVLDAIIGGKVYQAIGEGIATIAKGAWSWLKNEVVKAGAKAEEFLTFTARTYETGFRGLTNGVSSARNIQAKVETFVTEVRTKTKGLFDEINVNSAFYGDQTKSLDQFIDTASKCVEEVSTAVKDLHEALAKVAGSNYSDQQNAAMQDIQTAASNMESATSDALGNAKWN